MEDKSTDEFLMNLGAGLTGSKYMAKEDVYIPANHSHDLDRKLASELAKYAHDMHELENNDSYDFVEHIFTKIASTPDEEWTLAHDEIIEGCTKHAATALINAASNVASLGVNAVTPIISLGAGGAINALPYTGQAIGAGIYNAEHMMNEDEKKTEELKAIIAKYKQMAAMLDREINVRKQQLEESEKSAD